MSSLPQDLSKYYDGTPEEARELSEFESRSIPPPDDPREVARFVLAEVFHGDRLARVGGTYWVWTGTHWREPHPDEFDAKLYDYLDGKHYQTPKGLAAPWKPDKRKLSNVEHALRSLVTRDPYSEPRFGSGHCVSLRNVILDIRETTTYRHTPKFWTTYSLDFDYDPDDRECPHWLAFLESVFEDDREAVECVQEIMGYLLAGETSFQKLFLFLGPKRAGKGTIFRILAALLGSPNVTSPTLSDLGTDFGAMSLIGRPVALIGEAREVGRNDGSTKRAVERLLTISGEDVQTIPRKFRDPWSGRLPTRFLMSSNIAPSFRDSSGALVSRLVLVEFRKSFYGMEDKTLDAKLYGERGAIFNWALDGYVRLQKRGHFVQPSSAADRLQMISDLAAPVEAFVRSECVLGPDYRSPKTDLYNAWVYWNELHGSTSAGKDSEFWRDIYSAFPDVKSYDPGPRADDRRPHVRGIALREDE